MVSYVVKGLGLYHLAKRQKTEYPWLAFVPFARTYLQGEISGDITLKKKTIHKPGIWMIIIPFLQGLVFFLFYIVTLIFVGWAAYSTTMRMHSFIQPSIFVTFGVGNLVGTIVLTVLFVGGVLLVSAFAKVLKVLVNHQILKRFTSDNMSIVHAVLMGIIPLYEPICLLVMSRRPYNLGMEPEDETAEHVQEDDRNDMQQSDVQSNDMDNAPSNDADNVPSNDADNVPSSESQSEQPTFIPQRGLMNVEKEEQNQEKSE